MPWMKRNIHLLLSVLLLTATITIFGPIEFYFTNYEEFWFTRKDALIVSAILAIGCLIIFTAVGILLRGKARDFYSCILFAVGIALYVQGNYANIDYGVLDGSEIDWGAYPVYAVLDTLGWLLLITGAVFLWLRKKDLFYKIQKYVSVCIMAVQLITLVTLFLTTDVSAMEKSDYYLSNEGIYEVSSENNIIIFILDAFDDAYFQEILNEEPEKYQDIFQDFTHFNNAAAGGARTKIAMPIITTGESYPGEVSYIEYVKQSFNKDGLYSALQKENYDVRLYTAPSYVPDDVPDLVNNQVSTGYVVSSHLGLAKEYLSLTLYRYVPHVLKRFFWIYTDDFDQYKSGASAQAYTTDDIVYFDGLQDEGLQVNQDKNAFRLFHLNGAHPPYILNEYAQSVDSEDTSAVRQGKGALYIVENYISQLKSLGLYDAATIVIMADHGEKNFGEHGILLMKQKNQEMPKKNLLVTLDLLAVYTENGPQRVECYVNDVLCYMETLSEGKQLQFVVPGSLIQEDRILTLRLDLPDAVRPALLFGEGYDQRTLALALQGLQIDETAQAAESE